MTRPVSVTVVVWVIIAIEFEAMVGVLSGLATPVLKAVNYSEFSIPTLIWLTLFSASLSMAFGFFMLKGADWARVAYVVLKGLGAFGMLVGFLHGRTNPVIFVSFVGKYILFAYLLFRAEANAYFRPSVPIANGLIDDPHKAEAD
jgi:hypothetical protein